MKNIDIDSHVRGESVYVDDIPVREETLYGAVFDSPIPHGILRHLDVSEAEQVHGVTRIFTAKDIPGENQIGIIMSDEPLFAEGMVHYAGQPIALVLAGSEKRARTASRKIRAEIDRLPSLTDPREAAELGQLITPPRTFCLGDTEAAWHTCDYVFEGCAETGGQEHLYIETQSAYASPREKDGVRIFCSNQSPTVVQKAVARVLNIPMHQVEVNVSRIGGAFGGKESQGTAWAVMAALAAFRVGKAVKLVLNRHDDMRMTGKRHPYASDFRIGLSKDYAIKAYEVCLYQNAGAFADLSPAVLERTLFHATNSYFIPNVRATAYSGRTNLPPNTAMRGFGGPQGMFVMEAAIARSAEALGVEASVIQRKNLLRQGEEFPYGQKAGRSQAIRCWTAAEKGFNVGAIRKQVKAFNSENRLHKKGIAFMPICFGISFTKIHMNQAGALVHIYQDGSVAVSTGATEMGQGVNTKMVQVVAQVLSISTERVKIETTDTTRVANTSPTAASVNADMNGKAVEKACLVLLNRLKEFAGKELGHGARAAGKWIGIKDERVYDKDIKTELEWKDLVMRAHLERVDLSEHAFYATPGIHFDPKTEKGNPFAYHVYGTAITVATVDCLRGTYEIEAVHVVHDFGNSMNPIIDKGQTEGGIVQGIGWMTMEELCYSDDGRLLSDTMSTYKVPDVYSAPKELNVHFHETQGSPRALFRSKAVGEPSFMYGIGAYFAIRNAIRAARPDKELPLTAPMTPERVLLSLYDAPRQASGNS
jgi:xanthine dehydrogenase large subunit